MNTIDDLKEIEIRVKLNQKGSMLAQVEVSDGILRILGFRVMRDDSEQGMYVQPPSVRLPNGQWLKLVFIDDLDIWKALENEIKNEYLREVKRHNEKITGDVERNIELPSPEKLLDELEENGEL